MSFFTNLNAFCYVLSGKGSVIRNLETGKFVSLEDEFGPLAEKAKAFLIQRYEAEVSYNDNKEDSVDNSLDMYNDNVTTVEGEDMDNQRKDVLGDLPNWDELSSWEEYAKNYFWFKYQIQEDGCRKPVYTNPKKNYHYQDGASWGRNTFSADALSSNIDLLAWSEGVMLKLTSKSVLDKAAAQVERMYEADTWGTLEDGAEAIYDNCMAEARQAWIETTKAKMEKAKEMIPAVNKFLKAKEGRISTKELVKRIEAYAKAGEELAKTKDIKDSDVLFEFRKNLSNKLFEKVKPSLALPEGWFAPKVVMSFIGTMYWIFATNRFVQNQEYEAAAEERVNNPLVKQWAKTYCRYILQKVWMERKAQDNHVDVLSNRGHRS
jgi:hypothetical protein